MKTDWKNTSRQVLSQIESAASSIKSALSSGDHSDERLYQLHQLLRETERAWNDAAIERMFAQASPKQEKAINAYFQTDPTTGMRQFDTVAILGGNRSGKSFCAAPCIARDIRDNAPPDSSILCVTVNSELSAGNQQKLLWDFLPRDKMGRWVWSGPKNGFGSENPTIIYDERTPQNPTGRNVTIRFKTQSQYENRLDAFEGFSAWKAWVDESVSQECLAAVRTRVALSDGAQVLISSIPNSEWFADFRREAKTDANTFLIELYPEDNPIMTPEKLRRFLKGLPDHLRALRAQGKPLVEGATVYTEFDDRHIITHREFKQRTEGDVTWYACMDSGMDHPTVWLLCGVSRDGVLYVYDEYTSRNTTPSADAKQILARIGNRKLRWPTVADPAMWQNRKSGKEAQQYRESGLSLVKARRTSDWGEDFGVNRIKDMLRNDELFVCDTCTTLIANFYKWKYKRTRTGQVLETDMYEDRNNDALDALRYLVTKNPYYATSESKVIAVPYDH